MLLTLNQVISQITTLGAAHLQIQSTGVGDFAEWQALERAYPLLWVFHETTSIGDRELVYSIRLVCADRVITGEEGDDTAGMEQEVLSDTLLILLDFLAYFQQQHAQSYKVITNASIDPFTERFNDRVAGNSVLIQIRQPFTWDACQIPQTGATIPPSVDGLTLYDFCDPSVIARLTPTQVACLEAEYGLPCADATIELNGVQVATVAAGGIEDIAVVNTGSAPVGTWNGTEFEIANSTVNFNGVPMDSVKAENPQNYVVRLDGVQSGVPFDVHTWDVTSAPCSPVALQINGTPQESIAAGATFNLIATLDGVAGGTYTPATDTLAFTSTGAWVRPSFWPALPTLTAASEAGYILLPVYENRLNRFTLAITNLTSNIDWGDGTNVTSNGAAQTKTYTYGTIAGTVYVDANTGENYKFVTIGITRIAGAITSVDFTASAATSPLNAPSYAVDYNLSFPNATTFTMGQLFTREPRFVQILRIWALGSIATIRIGNCSNLRILQLPATMAGSFGAFAGGIGPCVVPDLNFGTATGLSSAFQASRILSHGNLTANSTNSLAYAYFDNMALENFGTITANASTTIEWMFANNFALKSVGLLTLGVCSNYSYAFYLCYSLVSVMVANAANCTNTTGMLTNCYSLQVLDMPNLTRGVNFTNTAIGNYGMNIFANSLGTASGAQTITITGTPFGVLVTAADATALAIRAVMTGKGYTIAN